MKPKFHKVLEIAVEQGVSYGYRRSFKHIENPTEESICENIEEQVMSSLYDYFTFEDEE
jgi:hypothetical protein